MDLNDARWAFYLDVSYARQVFDKHRFQLSDLSPRFWEAFQKLEKSADQSDWTDLKLAFDEARKQLGAPGDFGYGTPCGDALRVLYESWKKLCKAMPAEEPVTAV